MLDKKIRIKGAFLCFFLTQVYFAFLISTVNASFSISYRYSDPFGNFQFTVFIILLQL